MAQEINIDATNLIVGRLDAYVVKKALLGNKLNIFNSEKAVFSGNREYTLRKYHEQRKKGGPLKGPFRPRLPDMFLKRTMRGMLSHNKSRARDAFGNIRCYIGVPEQFKNTKLQTLDAADAKHLTITKITTVGEVCKSI